MKKRKVLSSLLLPAILLYLFVELLLERAKKDAKFADLINSGISHAIRKFMATLTSNINFSIFEVIVVCIPILVIILIILAVKRFKRREGRLRLISTILSITLILLSGNTICLGFGYRITSLRSKLNLPSVEVTEDRLADILIQIRDELNRISKDIEYSENGTSVGHDIDKTSELICLSFDTLSDEYGFFENYDSKVKLVKNGPAMTMLGISGIYTYYTGESNVNSAFPISEITFVAAHELSHQRGIMRENEANFMAFLVTVTSDDAYLNYSGYLSMYQYIASALYRTNPDRYYEINRELSGGPRADIIATNDVIIKYADTFIADISEFINDIFLKSNGTSGVVTYGEVVKLTVAYYASLGKIN